MPVSPRRILVIDSDLSSGGALQQLITSWGYDAVLERNAVPDIAAIAKLDPAVIIDSPTFDSRDGFDVLRHIKTEQSGIPVILLADKGSVELAMRAIQEE